MSEDATNEAWLDDPSIQVVFIKGIKIGTTTHEVTVGWGNKVPFPPLDLGLVIMTIDQFRLLRNGAPPPNAATSIKERFRSDYE